MTLSGIEPATSRYVVLCLHEMRYRVRPRIVLHRPIHRVGKALISLMLKPVVYIDTAVL